MIRTNQGGSVASFIIVAALLVLGTAGLLYFVKRGDAPKSGTPVAVSDNKDKKPAANNGQKVDENTGSTNRNNSNSSSNSGRGAQNNKPSTSGTTNNSRPTPVTELSQTGPAETFAQIVMVGILAAALMSYMQSRGQVATRRSSL